jgi:hypothetical protein
MQPSINGYHMASALCGSDSDLTGRRDGHGNYYRYRGAVQLTSGRTVPIWDVFLATGPTTGSEPEELGEMLPLDDDSTSVAMSAMAGVGPTPAYADDDAGVASDPALPDPPPTPLQVVEYYHLDALGSVRAVTDAQGQVIARHDFLPFGEECCRSLKTDQRPAVLLAEE